MLDASILEKKNSVRVFFDEKSESWRERYDKHDFESVSYQDRMNIGLEFLRAYKGESSLVLDAGCGAGVQAAELARDGYRVLACDIAPEMVKQTTDRLAKTKTSQPTKVILADLDNLPLENESVEAILSLGVIGYSRSPDDLMRSFHRVLKTEGVLVISSASEKRLLDMVSDFLSVIPDRIYLAFKKLFVNRAAPKREYDEGFYKQTYTYLDAREFDAYVSAHGFEKLNSGAANFGRLLFMGKRVLPTKLDIALSRAVGKLARLAPFRFLERYARIYVVCLKKTEVS